ncbi:UNVERIFIED_CONTAM: Cytosolic sulfotransferase 15 [Sesamum angustifolium]|uniref:Sulfotransferase n=1 Tax=Sesamum angustifolium TaxID=2727405 RepID=A0AAW2MH81_9LAMI
MENTENLSSEDESLLLQSLEQHNWDGLPMSKFQGFWCPVFILHPLLCFQRNFKALDTDVLLASVPKSGTTWLKALLFSIVSRDRFPIDQSPLLATNSHRLVFSLECFYYAEDDDPDLGNLSRPRLFSTHLPHQALPSSLIESNCKIVYVCRNPLDQFISEREFLLKNRLWPDKPYGEVLSLDEAFDMFCDGVQAFGPFWDHLLGYWNASLENPDRVLFLKYEDIKRDPLLKVKKIAEFVGLPFSEEEEKEGLVGDISRLCSFEKLKDLEINKNGIHFGSVKNNSLFRKGDIGDWQNYLTPAMAEWMKTILEAKLSGSGLILDI